MFVVERVARNGFGERGWKGECLDNVWCIFMEADNNINLEKKKNGNLIQLEELLDLVFHFEYVCKKIEKEDILSSNN